MYLSHQKYIMDITNDLGLQNSKRTNVSLSKGMQLHSENGPPLNDPSKYKILVSKLIYLNLTRPYISFYNPQLSQHMNSLGCCSPCA